MVWRNAPKQYWIYMSKTQLVFMYIVFQVLGKFLGLSVSWSVFSVTQTSWSAVLVQLVRLRIQKGLAKSIPFPYLIFMFGAFKTCVKKKLYVSLGFKHSLLMITWVPTYLVNQTAIIQIIQQNTHLFLFVYFFYSLEGRFEDDDLQQLLDDIQTHRSFQY